MKPLENEELLAVMQEMLVAGSVNRIVFALLALVMIWLLLRLFDRMSGVKFKRVMHERISTDAAASAWYFGLRFVGACYLVGSVIS